MEPTQQQLEKYADLAIHTGVNLQEGQAIMINAPVESADFVRTVARKAYEAGAKDVHVRWNDEDLTYLKMKHAPMEVLENVAQWKVDEVMSYAKDGAAILSIYAPNPDLLKDIDPERVAATNKASGQALKEYRQYIMNDKVAWSIVSVPTENWARKIFPELDVNEAIDQLWDKIFQITRVDQEDPIQAWEEHNATLRKAREYLNQKQYKKLVYKAPGTDLSVQLVDNHIWHGGDTKTQQGVKFNPNMPTEEVFTMPHKDGVNGTVTSTKPLNYAGNLIENFTLTFENGKVVDFKAEKGEETLKLLLDTDEGARHLGEVALVPHHSPISQSELIFFNTLYDENASCHLALGGAYPTNIKGGSDMNDEEKASHGVNDSMVHEDFMMGSADMDIDGVLEDGTTEPVFRNGNWAIDFD
ncbi:aminopeptidase [Pontibacillus yanchengensis]|uniref:Aminopeptidase n=2 Tax=Pontibacillus yanchengensis TaxID=462910 RepID=A0ACC7VIH9_9BACI|nr:aminopeptidase [Pontibacillus yanchengensis]MYL34635.1 aminopeptidase [Pontibacillus yanchengensis]MYL54502.1 aminopeptidase [Pontibacillus yanchengensis]